MRSTGLVVLEGWRKEGSARDAGMKLRNSSLHINAINSTLQRLIPYSRNMELSRIRRVGSCSILLRSHWQNFIGLVAEAMSIHDSKHC